MGLQKCPDCKSDVSSLAISCPKCGRPTTPNPPPASSVTLSPAESREWIEAGFGVRLLAWFLDQLIYITAVCLFVALLIAALGGDFFPSFGRMFWKAVTLKHEPDDTYTRIGRAIGFVLNTLYYTLFVASSWQATPGKRIMGLKVMTEYGDRVGRLNAFWRYLCQYISFLILGFGYLMILFTDRKQGLHDFMAVTVVCERTDPGPGPEKRTFSDLTPLRYDEKEH